MSRGYIRGAGMGYERSKAGLYLPDRPPFEFTLGEYGTVTYLGGQYFRVPTGEKTPVAAARAFLSMYGATLFGLGASDELVLNSKNGSDFAEFEQRSWVFRSSVGR